MSLPKLSMCIVTLVSPACLLLGCGKTDRLETAVVVGKVTLDGKPLKSGSVMFVPERGHSASGTIRPDGSFSLSTYGDNDGAIIGVNQVTVTAWDGDSMEGARRPLVPIKYMSPGAFGMTREVKTGRNEVMLELSNK
jgi:hypothetical protein